MTPARRKVRLLRLLQVARMIRDARLAQLRQANDACQQTEAALHALVPQCAIASEDGHGALLAAERHARWVAARRAALNATLARQRVDVEAAQAQARRAFGKAQAVESLLRRLEQRGR